ncbi:MULTISPECIES: homoserine dehydrogenase [Acidithiobacillus]|jgi:homoserine dehydrogenase|uniref:Homoserine dehydrogenase n=2 Tax=Acidithiobacillus caldus TaxID=33059 RepID=F9ZTE0_ACICS|nr:MULTISPECIES: homoserine dehydrogenase [Acidithiobacillus]AEK56961.1 Homoserine dehydrogenase [Acidithiobacillus caldus SM-1]AUW31755.1 homoserine dehydrogenase [Acidithiobacillus caldus]MBU2764501.1 homoserine dehydrogenase [Acidithiobacillus caldus]MBU2771800.1 homoserine dehydrogenase [Acidithiobacillus caldus]MBU2782780.1 homoserine dehydrogenase [Acidithiobacillus caldus]
MALDTAPVRVGILGMGTVGQGTVRVLQRNADEIRRRVGRELRICHAAVRKPERLHGLELDARVSADPWAVVRDPDIDVVVEVMGGIDPARALTLAALESGKHVVTANKALLALHGNEIFAAAQARGLMVAFEAAVAGAIPIVKTIREGLAGNRIQSLMGIINGTSNYILTQMYRESWDFERALAAAQELGYAEADPSLDVDGGDAAHKITLMASVAFGIPVDFAHCHVEGIRHLQRQDVAFAAELGYRIKLLGITRRCDDGVELRVHPTLIPASHLLASVEGPFNAILVHSDAAGQSICYGRGAGGDPTASAVVADLVDVARTMTADPSNRVPHLAFQADALTALPLLPMAAVESAYYLRIEAANRPGVLAQVAAVLAAHGVSIEALIQRERLGAETVPIVLVLHRCREADLDAALVQMAQLPVIGGEVLRLRIENIDQQG